MGIRPRESFPWHRDWKGDSFCKKRKEVDEI